MNSLELDHVFCFCDPDLLETAILENHGFTITSGRSHQGQGTANRSVLFEKNYLELIFLSSEHEAKENPLRLDRRALWKQTGASPFGIALRGFLTERDRQHFWEYNPPYLQSGSILIHRTSEGNGPPIFLVPPRNDTMSAMHPKNWPSLDHSLLKHSSGSKEIVSLQLIGPDYHWPLANRIPNINLMSSDSAHMKVSLEGRRVSEISMNSLVSIVIS
jgi:hypothetical protein